MKAIAKLTNEQAKRSAGSIWHKAGYMRPAKPSKHVTKIECNRAVTETMTPAQQTLMIRDMIDSQPHNRACMARYPLDWTSKLDEMKQAAFEAIHPKHKCRNCGCRQEQHRGGSVESPKHNCPPCDAWGHPKAFPRTTYEEDQAYGKRGAYDNYWKRVDAYWDSSLTEFEAMS